MIAVKGRIRRKMVYNGAYITYERIPSKTQFEEAAAELAIDAAMVEKDWYVARVLAFLCDQQFPGFEIVFSGGTALSKAHGR